MSAAFTGVTTPMPRVPFTSANRRATCSSIMTGHPVFSMSSPASQTGLTVGELVRAARQYYDEVGIWSDAGWVGGYELGIGFPPDWVGNFVYEMSDSDSERSVRCAYLRQFRKPVLQPAHVRHHLLHLYAVVQGRCCRAAGQGTARTRGNRLTLDISPGIASTLTKPAGYSRCTDRYSTA